VTAPPPGPSVDHVPDRLATTRGALHAVAESLLAGHRYRVAGTIRLVVEGDGFTTGPLPGDPRRLTVEGTRLVIAAAGGVRTLELAGTLGSLATEAGVLRTV
jgi:hypothetical protein